MPDEPLGNTFAMANDDAAPCDCGMDSTSLISPVIDLSGASHPALSFRVYHDGRPANGRAFAEASSDGSNWTLLREIPARPDEWQELALGLDAFAGTSVRVRFRYDDAGDWGSGLAIDDVCVFDRPQHDLVVLEHYLGDPSISPFNTSVRSQGYTFLPMEQQNGLVVSLRVRNAGYDTMHIASIQGSIQLDGSAVGSVDIALGSVIPPLSDSLITVDTGWNSAAPGAVTIGLSIVPVETDEFPEDDSTSLAFQVTGPLDQGNMMGVDTDMPETVVGGANEAYSAGCRFETIAGSGQVTGISVRFGGGTEPGATVRALLADAELNVLASSGTHVITSEDIDLSFNGGLVYIPLDQALPLDEDRDVLALLRADADTATVTLAAGGVVSLGTAWKVQADGLSVSYPLRAPIVRLNLSEPAVGLPVVNAAQDTPQAWPNPATDHVWIGPWMTDARTGSITLIDALGRVSIVPVSSSAGTDRVKLDVAGLPNGPYVARAERHGVWRCVRFVIAR